MLNLKKIVLSFWVFCLFTNPNFVCKAENKIIQKGNIGLNYFEWSKQNNFFKQNNLSTIEFANIDTDGDGVLDSTDIDDDNDGVLDVNEKLIQAPNCSYLTTVWSESFEHYAAETGTVPYVRNYSRSFPPSDGYYCVGPNGFESTNTTNGSKFLHYNLAYVGLIYNQTTTSNNLIAGRQSSLSLDLRDYANGSSNISIRLYDTNGQLLASRNNLNLNLNFTTYTLNFTATTSNVRIELHSHLGRDNYGNDISIDNLVLKTCTASSTESDMDTDNDGIVNRLDLDSDGDGCPDSVESGVDSSKLQNGTLPDGNPVVNKTFINGQVSGLVGSNGFANNLETSIDSSIYNGTYSYANALNSSVKNCTVVDTDGDGVPDQTDVDDDNDGVLDSLETNSVTSSGNAAVKASVNNNAEGSSSMVINIPGSGKNVSAVISQTGGRFLNRTDSNNFISFSEFGGDYPNQSWNLDFGNNPVYDLEFYFGNLENSPNGDIKIGNFIITLENGTIIYGADFSIEQGNSHGFTSLEPNARDIYKTTAIASKPTIEAVYQPGGEGRQSEGTLTFNDIGSTEGVNGVRSISWTVDAGVGAGPTAVLGVFARTIGNSTTESDIDTDNDGIVNRLDLDSDGDTCPDSIESGVDSSKLQNGTLPDGNPATNTTFVNGQVSGIVGANGFANNLETSVDNGVYNGTYTYANAVNSNVENCTVLIDTDGDGVPDQTDIDDDNDGVLDTEEQECTTAPALNTSTTYLNNTHFTHRGNTYAYPCNPNDPGRRNGNTSVFTNSFYTENDLGGTETFTAKLNYGGANNLVIGSPVTLKYYFYTPNVNSIHAGTHAAYFYLNGTLVKAITNNPTTTIYSYTYTPTSLTPLDLKLVTIATKEGGDCPRPVPEVSLSFINIVQDNDDGGTTTCTDIDTDGDGIVNRLDLDSDGDDCPDSIESGVDPSKLQNGTLPDGTPTTSTTFVNGQVSGIVGANGFANNLETSVDNGVYNGTYTYANAVDSDVENCTVIIDTDGDGIPDQTDIDDDNDGVLDVIESCVKINATVGYDIEVYDFDNSSPSGIYGSTAKVFSDWLSTDPGVLVARGSFSNDVINWFNKGGGSTIINVLNSTGGVITGTPPSNKYYVKHSHTFNQSGTYSLTGNNIEFIDRGLVRKRKIDGTYEEIFTNTHPAYGSVTSSINFNIIAGETLEIIVVEMGGTLGGIGTGTSTGNYGARAFRLNTVSTSGDPITVSCDNDIDNDGIPNHLDLDSDGDGCPDSVESGVDPSKLQNGALPDGIPTVSTTFVNGQVSGTVGANGFANNLETSVDNGVYNGTYTYANAVDSDIKECNSTININIKVGLMSAHSFSANELMRTELSSENYIPVNSPYTNIANNNVTTEAVLSANENTENAIVDWVYFELRSKNDNTNILYSSNALLQADGDVVGVDGLPFTTSELLDTEYFVAINHRIHLGAMTAESINVINNEINIDFRILTDDEVYHKTDQYQGFEMYLDDATNRKYLWAGDVSQDNVISNYGFNNDSAVLFAALVESSFLNPIIGYHNEDVTMDGIVKSYGGKNDKFYFVEIINEIPIKQVFSGTYFKEQLPD